MLNWILGFTRLGKLNDWVSGHRTVLASSATALAGLSTIIVKTSEGGLGYLAHVAGTPEFTTLAASVSALFLALKGQRIEEKLDTSAQTPK